MKTNNLMASVAKKILIVILCLILVVAGGYFFWQKNKMRIIKNKIDDVLTTKTDSLYSITYDSLSFDELKGNAFLKNIRITADSDKIKRTDLEKLPYLFMDISIKSITVKGVKTDKALGGHK